MWSLRLAAHLHDTNGRDIVNALAAVIGGEWLDSVLTGLGVRIAKDARIRSGFVRAGRTTGIWERVDRYA